MRNVDASRLRAAGAILPPLIWSVVLACILLGCSVAGKDRTPDYRYRLTVEVDAPEGIRAGSSVIEVRQRLTRSAMAPASRAVSRRIRGQAVAVDLPGNKVLFALLRSENNVDWPSYILQWLAPDVPGETFEEALDDPLTLKGKVALPRHFPPKSKIALFGGESWPMLVTFRDINDPTTFEQVDPDDLAATFGEGVSIRRITVQLTEDPVTEGIDRRLKWLNNLSAYRSKPDNPFSNVLPSEIGAFRSK